jgi:cell division protein FtsZ
VPGLINTDFADVRMIMHNAGSAIMGIGQSTGEGRAVNAARAAITSPLLEASIEGARGILINIVGGPEITLFEVNEAAEIVHSVAHQDANIIFGSVVDDSLGDAVRVTVIAAGFERWESDQRPAMRTSSSGTPIPEPIDLFGDAQEAGEEFSFDLDDDGDDDIPSFLR